MPVRLSLHECAHFGRYQALQPNTMASEVKQLMHMSSTFFTAHLAIEALQLWTKRSCAQTG